jgi:predicted SprT family Zn-dependent metalloprotease
MHAPHETPHLTSTEPAAVEAFAAALLAQYDLDDWAFGWDFALRRLGQADFRRMRISVSRHFVARNGPTSVEDVIRHEVCHVLVGPAHGHDATFRAMARRVGCTPASCVRANLPPGRIVATCGGCTRVFRRHRRPRAGVRHWCKRCGPERGLLAWAAAQGEG